MRTEVIQWFTSEISELARECGIKDDNIVDFLDFFDQPGEWIHLLVEKYKDELAERKI